MARAIIVFERSKQDLALKHNALTRSDRGSDYRKLKLQPTSGGKTDKKRPGACRKDSLSCQNTLKHFANESVT